ncbi:MAG: CoA-binding protein [Deltaproteobacteria bacterium]|nr:CoA-binding protein [Deltaproteobacteria bacterium]
MELYGEVRQTEQNTISGNPLSFFMTPKGIAVIGSLKEEGWFGGYIVIRDLLNGPYDGAIFPVNPSYREVLGIKAYTSVTAMEGIPDLAVIIRARNAVPSVLEECGRKGVRAAIVVSDGFSERDDAGKRLQQEIIAIAKRYGMRVMGPNTVGVVNTWSGVTTVPYERGYSEILRGHLSIISQSGLVGPQALELADLNIGISRIIDLGNMCDVNETECLEYLEQDPETRVVSMYIENIRNGKTFMDVARRISRIKPVLCLKSGRSSEGARAMASHTGSMAGSDKVYEAAFRQTGILRIDEFRELLTLSKAFLFQPLPRANRIGIVSITGAGGIMALDCAEQFGLEPARLSQATANKLESLFPGLGKNPVDFGPAAAVLGDFGKLYYETIKALMEDDGVDSVFCTLYSTPLADPSFYYQLFDDLSPVLKKPITAWAYGTSQIQLIELNSVLERKGIPLYFEITPSIKALGLMARYAAWIQRERTTR